MKYTPNPFRTYTPEDVQKLRGSFNINHSLAQFGSNRLWTLFNTEPFVRALSAYTGNQAVQLVKSGIQSIYLSGWQVASEACGSSTNIYPDMSLYPSNAAPMVVDRINRALLAADRIEHSEGGAKRYWLAPIVADCESGFGGSLNAFELAKSMIEMGASGLHYEDMLSSEKRCGHTSSKVLVPTKTFTKHLMAARLASDVYNVPTVLIARTDSRDGAWITNDSDPSDHPFINYDKRSDDGFYALKGNPMERCISRGKSLAKYCDLIWFETSHPDIGEAREFSQEIRRNNPNQLFAYNNSPSFNWRKHLSDKQIASFQEELGGLGYAYSFITLSAWHSNALSTFELGSRYKNEGMKAYVELVQEPEFAATERGYSAVRHQREVGTSYYDTVRTVIDGNSDMSANTHSTEAKQF